ncbi:hypothetical protein [Eubacterium aggregans]|uniref:hypothetical protein n=1 Tax=Eubacterium aggregans TaxID=81409 RepID=UPI003F2A4D73
MVLLTQAWKDQSDIVSCGWVMECQNDSSEKERIILDSGYYSRLRIQKEILPILINSGKSPRRGLSPNRVTKLFCRELLLTNLDFYNEGVSLGEDLLTVFVNILSAKSITVMDDFFPYHYRRNDQSITKKYNPMQYEKIRQLYKNMMLVDSANGSKFTVQISNDYIAMILQQMEHEVLFSYWDVKHIKERIKGEYFNSIFQYCLLNHDKRKYSNKNKIYLNILHCKLYKLFIVLCKTKRTRIK